jgi:hypothetical protein
MIKYIAVLLLTVFAIIAVLIIMLVVEFFQLIASIAISISAGATKTQFFIYNKMKNI